jgi:hypothetical protein
MNRRKIFPLISLAFLFLAAASSQIAQNDQRPPIEPSYDVILQVVAGGDNKIPGQALPQNLSSVARQLKTNYNFPDIRLVNTYVGRVANGGDFEFKSVSNPFGRAIETDMISFLEWSLSGLRSGHSAAGKAEFMLQAFRFGARIPIKIGVVRDDPKQTPNFSYERVGLTSQRVSLAENSPTLLGSLALPGSDTAMFLVLTLRPA